jgi:hypothetical protein
VEAPPVTEPDVTITDFLLTVEAGIFAGLLARTGAPSPIRTWFVVFFGATALASLSGGLVHGFFPTAGPAPSRALAAGNALWRTVLVSLGVVALAAWAIGARLLAADRVAGLVTAAAWTEFVVYAAVVLVVTDAFSAAIVNYLPATLFLLAAFVVAARSADGTPLRLGVWGLVLTLVAAGVQRARLALHPVYFNHNALYHLLQAVALFLIFRSAASLAAR